MSRELRGMILAVAMSFAVMSFACGGDPLGEGEQSECEDDLNDAPGMSDLVDAVEATSAEGEAVLEARFPTDSGCTSAQQLIVQDAEALARRYIRRFFNRPAPPGSQDPVTFVLNAALQNQFFRNHFAPANLDDVLFVFQTYAGVRNALTATDYLCRASTHPDCIQADLVLATTAKASSTVRLCPTFFSSPARERAKTVIHELSHQDRTSPTNVGTDDLSGASIHNAHQYGIYAPRCCERNCF